ncbi:MAG TPA: type II secretion system F family protein [Segeticoccus sp.]|uniref:type II secretion system F family protein n=1 Tax=Segeticoccus sp. TaxID=2706531 RepID=UPI002D7F1177|nr:type II secretion system F family protein [Segeticoccus sp.]HET8600404.1 type II secretion system F family protein [Segeticoccus sp.]
MILLCAALLALAVLVWPSRRLRGPAAEDLLRSSGPRLRLGRGPGSGAGPTVPEVARAVHLLALSVRSGTGLTEAIDAVAAETGGAVGRQLTTVTAALRWGVDEQTAWQGVPAVWQPAARALQLAAAAGVPPAELLLEAADDLLRRERQRLDVSAARLGVRIVLPLGLAFLPAFVLTTVVPVVLALAQEVLGRP